MNSDEQREDRRERLKRAAEAQIARESGDPIGPAIVRGEFVSTLPTHAELVRKGARYCKHCGTDEAMPGHEC